MNKTIFQKFLFPIFLFLVGMGAILPNILNENNSSWVQSELFIFSVFQMVGIFLCAIYAYYNMNNSHWTQKYFMNGALFIAMIFYYYVSLSHDAAFPTLAAMGIVILIYIIPGLLLSQGIAFIVRKITK